MVLADADMRQQAELRGLEKYVLTPDFGQLLPAQCYLLRLGAVTFEV